MSLARLPWKRLLLALLPATLLLCTARSILGERGLLEVARQEDELRQIQAEVQAARARNKNLAGQVVELRKGRVGLERIARERLGYIRAGEVTYLFPPESSDSQHLAPRQ